MSEPTPNGAYPEHLRRALKDLSSAADSPSPPSGAAPVAEHDVLQKWQQARKYGVGETILWDAGDALARDYEALRGRLSGCSRARDSWQWRAQHPFAWVERHADGTDSEAPPVELGALRGEVERLQKENDEYGRWVDQAHNERDSWRARAEAAERQRDEALEQIAAHVCGADDSPRSLQRYIAELEARGWKRINDPRNRAWGHGEAPLQEGETR